MSFRQVPDWEDLMEIGMLWFDNDKTTSIPVRVEKAARYYQKKYGVDPDLCYVHPKTINGDNGQADPSRKTGSQEKMIIGKILVLLNKKVLPDHFWIGVGTAKEPLS